MNYDLFREEAGPEGRPLFRLSPRWGTLRHLLVGMGLLLAAVALWKIAPPALEGRELGPGAVLFHLSAAVAGFTGVFFMVSALVNAWRRCRLEIDPAARRLTLIESSPFQSGRREVAFKAIAAVWLRNDSFANQPESRSWRVLLEVSEESAVDLGRGYRDPAEALARRFSSLTGAPVKES